MEKEFSITFDSLYELLKFIEEQAKKSGLDLPAVNHLLIAVEEAFSNIIHYSGLDKDIAVTVSCFKKDHGFYISLKDCGVPCNPLEHMKVPSQDSQLGGNGIYLMKKLTDKLEYQRVKNYNILTLTKFLTKT